MFARLCAALSDLLAGRCCGCPPGGRLSRARAATPSGPKAEESSGAAALARPKRSCCVVSGASCEITSLRSSCDETHSVASSPSELASSPRELRRPAAACAARRVCNEAGLVAAAELGLELG